MSKTLPTGQGRKHGSGDGLSPAYCDALTEGLLGEVSEACGNRRDDQAYCFTWMGEGSEQYGALSLSKVSMYVQALSSLVFIRGN